MVVLRDDDLGWSAVAHVAQHSLFSTHGGGNKAAVLAVLAEGLGLA